MDTKRSLIFWESVACCGLQRQAFELVFKSQVFSKTAVLPPAIVISFLSSQAPVAASHGTIPAN